MGSKTGGQPRLRRGWGQTVATEPGWAGPRWAGARAGQQGATLQPPPYGTR